MAHADGSLLDGVHFGHSSAHSYWNLLESSRFYWILLVFSTLFGAIDDHYSFNSTTVIASPPRSAASARMAPTNGCVLRNSARPRRNAPVPWPWMMRT